MDAFTRDELLLDREFHVAKAAALRADLLALRAANNALLAARKAEQRAAAKEQQRLSTELSAKMRKLQNNLQWRTNRSLMAIKHIDKRLGADPSK